jgi:Fic family protein
VAATAQTTLALVEGVRGQMASVKKRLRDDLHQLYSQDLLNNLFRHPYTRIEFIVKDLQVSRQTAAKYLDVLTETGFVTKHRSGRSNYYVNEDLIKLFLDVSGEE